MSNITKDWELYEAGKKYNSSLNYNNIVDTNLAFFSGDQWRNVQANGLPTPVFNIIKRVITFFVASLTSSNVKLHLEPLLYSSVSPTEQMEMEMEASEFANSMILNLFEKFKMEYKIRDALFDAAITGDACAHFYFDITKQPFGGAYSDIQGEIAMELVDGTNVFFGNANNPDVHVQPYIIISGRDMVKNLQEEAKRYKQFDGTIQEDSNYQEQAGDSGKIEVEADSYGKATYIIVYRMENGTVKASKSVQNAYIYKDIDTGLKTYPVAFMNWEKQKNQYHGRAVCTGIIPNQIFINKMFAMVMYHLMMSAFPKAVYDAGKIEYWSNEIGEAIAVNDLQIGDDIKKIAGYLEPGNMSNQIVQVIELAMQYTKETLGVGDAALGQIDPKNTSAIIAVQKASAVPLENPRSNLYSWIEDIGKILVDMMGTYYGLRPITVEKELPVLNEFGEQKIDPVTMKPATERKKVVELFDFSILKNSWLNIKADVGESSYWSQIAANQTLENLLNSGYIDIIDFLERVDDELVPQKKELITKLQEKMKQLEAQQIMQSQLTPVM